MMKNEIRKNLTEQIIPFWNGMKDNEFGGFYGWLDYELRLDKRAVKGCILNSRILWFYSNAYLMLKDESLLDGAKHAYAFLKDFCLDKKHGGIYWSMTYDGLPMDTTKHTYNQAFAIYALSSYYDASGDKEAFDTACALYDVIEEKCTDEGGYLEAFTVDFKPESNEKLSENGVMAERTMNTLLHVLEAYTELYRVGRQEHVKERLKWILDTFADKIYNPTLGRQEVFFDHEYNSLIDLYSYGHDIETSWLVDRTLEVIGDEAYTNRITPITKMLAKKIYEIAFDGRSVANECDRGVVNEKRIWWVQAEAVVGFLNAFEKEPTHTEYYEAAEKIWGFIRDCVVDKRTGSEWFSYVWPDGSPGDDPIVEPWKCPYHNGRMCFEAIKRLSR